MMRKNKKTFRNAVLCLLVVTVVISGALAILFATDSRTDSFMYGSVNIELWERFDADLSGTVYEDTSDRYADDEIFGPGEVANCAYNFKIGEMYTKDPWIENVGSEDTYAYISISVPFVDFSGNTDISLAPDYNGTLEQYLSEQHISTSFPLIVTNYNGKEYNDTSWTKINSYIDTISSDGKVVKRLVTLYAYKTTLSKGATTDNLFDTVGINPKFDSALKTACDKLYLGSGNDVNISDLILEIPINAYAIESGIDISGTPVTNAVDAWSVCKKEVNWFNPADYSPAATYTFYTEAGGVFTKVSEDVIATTGNYTFPATSDTNMLWTNTLGGEYHLSEAAIAIFDDEIYNKSFCESEIAEEDSITNKETKYVFNTDAPSTVTLAGTETNNAPIITDLTHQAFDYYELDKTLSYYDESKDIPEKLYPGDTISSVGFAALYYKPHYVKLVMSGEEVNVTFGGSGTAPSTCGGDYWQTTIVDPETGYGMCIDPGETFNLGKINVKNLPIFSEVTD